MYSFWEKSIFKNILLPIVRLAVGTFFPTMISPLKLQNCRSLLSMRKIIFKGKFFYILNKKNFFVSCKTIKYICSKQTMKETVTTTSKSFNNKRKIKEIIIKAILR